MHPFCCLRAVACPLPRSSIDTDQLIPARFMSRSRSDGYGKFLLYDLRYDAEGRLRGGFPLDEPVHAGARILVTRRNFGAGSSREAAVYALVDYGIKAIISPSFGDIFVTNAVNNGLLPAQVEENVAETLFSVLAEGGIVSIDLPNLSISAGQASFPFVVNPSHRTKLLRGWDDIDLTRNYAAAIKAFAKQDAIRRPWARAIIRNTS